MFHKKIGQPRGSGESSSSSSLNFQKQQVNRIEIHCRDDIQSVAFLVDGKLVGGGDERKVRRWRVEDGEEVGTPIDVGVIVCNIAASQDGKWIVSGTTSGLVSVWNTESYEKVVEFRGHNSSVCAVDFSPDGTKITTGSADSTACVWSFLTANHQLLYHLEHNGTVSAVKFSPNGNLVATATWESKSVRIYDYENRRLLVDAPIKVSSLWNQSLAWAGDSKQLFALSHDGVISCIDASKGLRRFRSWDIHSSNEPRCIALANNGTFIVASANSWVSFWDTTTHKQIGTIHKHTSRIQSMAIASNYDFAMGGGRTITVQSLCDILPSPYSDDILAERDKWRTEAERHYLAKTVEDLLAQKEIADHEIACLGETVRQLRDELHDSQDRVNILNEAIEPLHSKIARLEETVQGLHTQHLDSKHKSDSLVQIIRTYECKTECETLYAEDRITDAAICLLKINTANEEVAANEPIMEWFAKFKRQCISRLEMIGDEVSSTTKREEAVTAYSTAFLLSPSNADTLLVKWARVVLIYSSANDALTVAAEFKVPRLAIHRAICNVLEEIGHIAEAIECFQKLQNEHAMETGSIIEWAGDFKTRCLKTLMQRGDVAMETASYKDAVVHYTTALALDPSSTDLLTKRSKARAGIGSWQDALEDADAAIAIDPSSPRGYERKHAALLGADCYDEAINAYNDMLLKLEQSPDPVIRELRNHYVSPSQTMAAIRNSVKRTQRDAPLVLIGTKTGRLCDEHERMNEFESDAKFKELVASTTTAIDNSRITQAVQEYFRYATFSHTWEGAEPLFHDVLHQSIHDLAASPTVLKLLMFCATVRETGLHWAWSDTCCINKTDSSILQESLTSIFQWYHRAALTIVHLKGIRSDSEPGGLQRSFWNTRAWTLQEFFASRVIRFYTEDWKPYLPQEREYNHKDSSAIMGEMAAANSVDVQVLLSLRPGSKNVRQKLCLAATRIATRQEDIAYSLFGIFDVSIPATYGEGEQRALGRLLQEVLTLSGDVTILAWTGRASDYNSCLPAEIDVYREPASPYIPSPIEDDKMNTLITELRTSLSNLDWAVRLYDRVIILPSPRLVSRRLSLSCIIFPLRGLSVWSGDSQRVYRATTSALGNVEITTTEDLSSLKSLVLVHPWLQCLFDPTLPSDDLIINDAEPPAPVNGNGRDSDSNSLSSSSSGSSYITSFDKPTRALRLFARLGQPFGALLLAPLSYNEYKRVASDHPIVVQLVETISPQHLAQQIRTLDIL